MVLHAIVPLSGMLSYVDSTQIYTLKSIFMCRACYSNIISEYCRQLPNNHKCQFHAVCVCVCILLVCLFLFFRFSSVLFSFVFATCFFFTVFPSFCYFTICIHFCSVEKSNDRKQITDALQLVECVCAARAILKHDDQSNKVGSKE